MGVRAALTVSALIMAAGGGPQAAQAQQEVRLAFSMIPEEARRIAQNAAPGVDFYEGNMEFDEGGRASIEIGGRDADGRHVEVDLYEEDGAWAIDEVERDITWVETPIAVRDTLAMLFLSSWRPTRIERSERPGDVVVYEMEGLDAAQEVIEVEIAADGAFISLSKYNAT